MTLPVPSNPVLHIFQNQTYDRAIIPFLLLANTYVQRRRFFQLLYDLNLLRADRFALAAFDTPGGFSAFTCDFSEFTRSSVFVFDQVLFIQCSPPLTKNWNKKSTRKFSDAGRSLTDFSVLMDGQALTATPSRWWMDLPRPSKGF